MKIRSAKITDALDLARIHVLGWQLAYRDIINADLLKSISIDEKVDRFKRAIRDKTEKTYVIEDDGKIIGFTTIGECRDDDREKNTGEIWGVYIDAEHWKQGYGKVLAKFGEKKLIRSGFKEIVLWTLKNNDASRKFYEKLGYEVEGKIETLSKYGEVEIIRYIKKV